MMKDIYHHFRVMRIFVMCILFSSCIPDDIELPSRVLSVTTSKPIKIASEEVTLSGKVNLVDTFSVTCGIIYDTSSELSPKSGTMEDTNANGDYEIRISGLEANTTYYYRAYAFDAGLYKYGSICSFKTDISVTTINATDITHSGAILGGSVNSSGEELTCGIIYGTSSTLPSSSCIIKSTISSSSYSVALSDLKADVTYYFCAFAIIDGEYRYGEVCSFKTRKEITVTTGKATNITIDTVTLYGTIHNSDELLVCGIIYDTSSTLSSSNGTKKSTTSSGTYSITISDLIPNTTYYYRAYVVVDGGYKNGEVCSFKTEQDITITTDGATNITDNGVTLNGTIGGSENSLTCGIIYGTSSNLSSLSGIKVSTSSSGTYSIEISGLNSRTIYYYCAYAVINGEYKYGAIRYFKTVNPGVAVDLGLSVKWASHNVGAESIEDYGDYYAWGESEMNNHYSWSTYKWCNGTSTTMTKYCTSSTFGCVDSKTVLDLSDDVAHVKWGGSWRMPTLDEIKELINDCSWSWTSLNGVYGYMVTASNGNSIFFPATGGRLEGDVYDYGSFGYYWSGTLYSNRSRSAYILKINNTGINYDGAYRYYGFTVRPVTE